MVETACMADAAKVDAIRFPCNPGMNPRARQILGRPALSLRSLSMKPALTRIFLPALIMAATVGQAREPLRDLADIGRLEARVTEVSAKALPATVALLSDRTGASGSGVITSPDGLILTAAHVIQGAEVVLVVFPDGKQVQGRVLGANYSKDIAMVKIEDAGEWPSVTLGASKDLDAGDWVVALGHSAGFDPARTPPVRFGRVISKGPGYFITTDCTLIGGDSGGPLFDLRGRLIGIHSSIGKSLANNNHAGVDGFREDWDRLLAGETWGALSLNPFANPEMPVLGIGMAMMRGVRGVIVESVVANSPAAAAGVRPGDVIHQLDGNPVRDGGELLQLLAKRQAGETVKLGVQRERGELETDVMLKRRSELYEP
jgi:serine protease Do